MGKDLVYFADRYDFQSQSIFVYNAYGKHDDKHQSLKKLKEEIPGGQFSEGILQSGQQDSKGI